MVAGFTVVSVVVAGLVTLFSLHRWIDAAHELGFTGKDLNKFKRGEVAEAGGIAVVLGIIVGFFLYLGFHVFYYVADPGDAVFAFAAVTTVLLAAFIGFIDDILGWRSGLSQGYKVLVTFFIPLPVMVLNAGDSTMALPFFGPTELGVFFPLVVVPAVIIGTTNAFNMLAGFNGLEAGLGVIILSTMGWIAFVQSQNYVAALCLVAVTCLVVFLFFNVYPASVFPGDTLTYGVGAIIGTVAILADIEKFALFLIVPYFVELVLKGRTFFQKASWAKADWDGSLTNRYGRWYGWPNVMISLLNGTVGRAREWQVVALVWCVQALCAVFTLAAYYRFIPV